MWDISITEYLFKVHKPSASQDEDRRRGLERIIYSKITTLTPPTGIDHQRRAGYTCSNHMRHCSHRQARR